MVCWKPTTLWLLIALSPVITFGQTAELLPDDQSVTSVVDFYIQQSLQTKKLIAANPASDVTLLRRTTLDLVGRIPTGSEARTYSASTATDKRLQMVKRLMQSPGFLQHQVSELDSMLSPEKPGDLQSYLTPAITENRPWDRIFRDLILPQPNQPNQAGANRFIKSRLGDIDKLTNDTSTLFFGVNISCAKCHDHPLVEQWTQSHFFGMKSFFSRTFDNGDFLGERDYGAVEFKTTVGETKTAPLMFLSGKIIDEPSWQTPTDDDKKKIKKQLEELKKKKQPPPQPAFSRRSQLVDIALSPAEQQFFARNIVNRVWYRIFGYGLVMPLDQMHEVNPASHPQLLQWLARDMINHKYDLRRLIQGLVLSQAYARRSNWDQGPRPEPEWFAVANIKPLSRDQYGHSLKLASLNPDSFTSNEENQNSEQLKRLYAENKLAQQLDQPVHDFQVSTAEALLFSNSEQIAKELLNDGNKTLVGKLKSLETNQQVVDVACWTILSRPVEAEERSILIAYLVARQDRRGEGIEQLVWALLTSTEFRFNH